MRRIVWSIPALEDLRSIDDWLTREASSDYAVRVLAAIRFRAKFLQDFPHGGRPYRDGTRVLRVFETPYLIHYRLIGEGAEVIRVYHERENWQVAF